MSKSSSIPFGRRSIKSRSLYVQLVSFRLSFFEALRLNVDPFRSNLRSILIRDGSKLFITFSRGFYFSEHLESQAEFSYLVTIERKILVSFIFTVTSLTKTIFWTFISNFTNKIFEINQLKLVTMLQFIY